MVRILVIATASAFAIAVPLDASAHADCFEEAVAAMRLDAPVRIDLIAGGSTRGIGLALRGDSLFVDAFADGAARTSTVAYSRRDVAGLAFDTEREVNPHWGIIGFVAGYFIASGAYASQLGAPLMGFFGGVVAGAAAATFLPPVSVGSETYIRCD